MATLTFTTKIAGVLTNVTSVTLSDPAGAYGIQRVDTGVMAVAVDAAMSNTSAGTYAYDFSDAVGGVEYRAYVKWVYAGKTHYVESIFTASGDTIALTGLTLKQNIRSILANDAKLMDSGRLGALLGYDAVTKPECVFYQNPPERVSAPLITYRLSGEVGHWPRNVFVDIVVWGGDFTAAHNRVFDLLNQKLSVNPTDWSVKGILYESSGPELWDENLKCYFQRARYRIITLKL